MICKQRNQKKPPSLLPFLDVNNSTGAQRVDSLIFFFVDTPSLFGSTHHRPCSSGLSGSSVLHPNCKCGHFIAHSLGFKLSHVVRTYTSLTLRHTRKQNAVFCSTHLTAAQKKTLVFTQTTRLSLQNHCRQSKAALTLWTFRWLTFA